MKPMTEKMTKPAKMLVALLVHVTIKVSLQRKHKEPVGFTPGRLGRWISAASRGHTHILWGLLHSSGAFGAGQRAQKSPQYPQGSGLQAPITPLLFHHHVLSVFN